MKKFVLVCLCMFFIGIHPARAQWKFVANFINPVNSFYFFSDYGAPNLGLLGTGESGSGGEIWRTTDGGKTWLPTNIQKYFGCVVGFSFKDSLVGWAGTGQGCLKTTDGGKTWKEMPLSASGMDIYYSKVSKKIFVSTANGPQVCSTDQGLTWVPFIEESLFNGFSFANDSNGVLCPDNNGKTYYITHDGGNTWKEIGLHLPCVIRPLMLPNTSTIIVCPYAYQVVYRSFDFGKTWQALPYDHWSNSTTRVGSCGVLFSQTHYVTDSAGVIYSTDLGTTWHSLGGPSSGGGQDIYIGEDFLFAGALLTDPVSGHRSGALWRYEFNEKSFCPPVSRYIVDDSVSCKEMAYTFRDTSERIPTSWKWVFEQGEPSVSLEKNPGTISYANPGRHLVHLITSNEFGTDSLVNYVIVPSISGTAIPQSVHVSVGPDSLITLPIVFSLKSANSVDTVGVVKLQFTLELSSYIYLTAKSPFGYEPPDGWRIESINLDAKNKLHVTLISDQPKEINTLVNGGKLRCKVYSYIDQSAFIYLNSVGIYRSESGNLFCEVEEGGYLAQFDIHAPVQAVRQTFEKSFTAIVQDNSLVITVPSLQEYLTISVMDVLGRTLLSSEFENVNSKCSISLSDLPSGNYTVVVKGKRGDLYTHQIAKIR